jgi:GDP-D-mannose dehydratase
MLKPMPESAIKAEVFVTSKVKKKVAEITPKPRTALLQEGENDVTVE